MTELEAHMQADYGLFILKKYLKELNKPVTSIDAAIDKACGRDMVEEIRKNAVNVLDDIIKAKSFLGYDCEKEKELIDRLKR